MVWIKTQDGYVRQDSIIDVHISPYYSETIFFRLISGDTIKFFNFKTEEAARDALEKIIKELDKES